MSSHSLLVTGTSGFVGAALARRLVQQGHAVTLVGRQAEPLVEGCRVAVADLATPSSLRAALSELSRDEPFDAIIHLAVSRHHREFPARALDMFYVNSAAVAELLDFARATGVRRAVFGSTGTVYSAVASADKSEVQGNGEGEFNRPVSYFAASKLFADALCDLYRGFLPIAVLRFYAPYGPGLRDRMLTDLVQRVRQGTHITLPTAGPGLSFAAIYVDDAVATVLAAVAEGWNETVNVAASETWTIESAGRLIADVLGRPVTFARSAALSAPHIVPNTARLQALLPNMRFTGLRDGLVQMIAAEEKGW